MWGTLGLRTHQAERLVGWEDASGAAVQRPWGWRSQLCKGPGAGQSLVLEEAPVPGKGGQDGWSGHDGKPQARALTVHVYSLSPGVGWGSQCVLGVAGSALSPGTGAALTPPRPAQDR